MSGVYGKLARRLAEVQTQQKELSVLSEECIGRTENMCIHVYQQETRKLKGDPENAYMEVYNNKAKNKATKMIRLVIGAPYYRDHSGQQPLWDDMNSKEKKELKELLNSPTVSKHYTGKTVFQAALSYYNIDPNLPVTDYTNMIAEPSSNQKKKDSKTKK